MSKTGHPECSTRQSDEVKVSLLKHAAGLVQNLIHTHGLRLLKQLLAGIVLTTHYTLHNGL